MRVTTDPIASIVGIDLRTLTLSKAERDLLRRASVVLAAIREAVTDGDLDDERGHDVGMASYTCADLADEGKVDIGNG